MVAVSPGAIPSVVSAWTAAAPRPADAEVAGADEPSASTPPRRATAAAVTAAVAPSRKVLLRISSTPRPCRQWCVWS